MRARQYRPGDIVIYRKSKYATHPGPRAHDVRGTPKGDGYTYVVDKFWVVRSVLGNGQLLLETPGGKTHQIDPADPNLGRPTLWQRFRYRARIAALQPSESSVDSIFRTIGLFRG